MTSATYYDLPAQPAITPVSTAEMMADLSIVLPCLQKRRLCDFGADYAEMPGVWTVAADAHVMPDGIRIFFPEVEPPRTAYSEGAVHEGFERWLQNRGWIAVRYDRTTFWLLPWDAVTLLPMCAWLHIVGEVA